MIKVAQSGDAFEDIRRLAHALNFSESILPFAAITADTGFGVTLQGYGGVIVDRSVFRKRLPDTRWFVYAAGIAAAPPGQTATASLFYQKDDLTTVTLGTVSTTNATGTKLAMGPFSVFDTAGVPPGETFPVIRLGLQATGAGGLATAWVIFLRLLTSKQ